MEGRLVRCVSLLMSALGMFGDSCCFGAKCKAVLKDRKSKVQRMFPSDNGVKAENKVNLNKKEFLEIFVVYKLLSESIFGVPKVYDKISCEILRRSIIDAISLSDDIINKEEAKRFIENMRFQTMSRCIYLVEENIIDVIDDDLPFGSGSGLSIDRKSYFLSLCRIFFGKADVFRYLDFGEWKIVRNCDFNEKKVNRVIWFARACIDTGVFSFSDRDNKFFGELGYSFGIRILTSGRNYGSNSYDYARVVNDWYGRYIKYLEGCKALYENNRGSGVNIIYYEA